jgi:bifunctional non-homologous end joining protein LigD
MELLPMTRLTEGPEWVYEVKLDGYRAQVIQTASGVRLLSRRGKDLSRQFRAAHAALNGAMPAGSVIDGELAALDPQGRPNFNLIQNVGSKGAPVVFFAFDVLTLAGRGVRMLPLRERQQLLRDVLRTSDLVQLSESFSVPAERMIAMVREHDWRV